MALFTVRYHGVRGGVTVVLQSESEQEAVSAYRRQLEKITKGSITLHRGDGDTLTLLMRGEAVPLPMKRKKRLKARSSEYLAPLRPLGSKEQVAKELRETRKPGVKRIRFGHEPNDSKS
jgi:hypothetical protein